MTDAHTKRQRRAATTADQLLSAAREVFEDRGYVATTVGAITEAANTAHGTFYLYFRNKEDAFAKVVEGVAGELYLEARGPAEGDPYQTLDTAMHGYLEVFSRHRGLWRCLLEGMYQSAALEQMWMGLRRPFVERIQHGLDRMLASGEIRAMDSLLAAEALGSMVEWTAFCYVELGEPAHDRASLEDVAHSLTDLWFNAVHGRVTSGVLDRRR